MRFLTNTFQLPYNLEQQLERNVAPVQTLLGSLLAIFLILAISNYLDSKVLAATTNLAFISSFIVFCLIGLVAFANQKQALRFIFIVPVVLSLYAIVVVYKNGYLPITFAMPVTLLTLLAYRGRFRLLVPYLFVAAWAITEHLSPVQAAESYVLRLTMLNVILIYPLSRLLDADEWSPALFKQVFKNILLQGMILILILYFIRSYAEGEHGNTSTYVTSLIVFAALYVAFSRGWLSPVRAKLAFSLALLALYWYLVGQNGLLPTMFIMGFVLLYFLLLPAFDALMLSVSLLVVSLLGIYNAPSIDFELTPFVSRHVVASLMGMVVFYSLFKQREDADSLSFSAIAKALPIALSITLGIILLEIPVFETNSFNSAINETQVRLLVGLSTMFILITWITSRYWHSHEGLQRALSDLSATKQELAASLSQARKQTQQMELMAEGGGVGFFECDLTGGTLRGNATLMARMNLPEDAVISMAQVAQNVPEAAREAFQQDLQASIEAGPGAIKTFTHPYVTASGELASYRVIATTEMRGEKLLALGVSIDITDELDAKDKAEHAAQALAVEQDRQKQMFAVISHEIRTPAASLNMLIHHKGVTAQDPADAEKMTEISDHLVSVLEDLRFVIKPDQAKLADEKAVELFITIDKMAASLSVLLEQNGQAIKTLTEGQPPSVLSFNVQLVRQIVTNLVKNASIHSGASEIVLRLSASEQSDGQWMVFINIEDNGRGIASAEQEKLFEAFSRGSTGADGTGLGLYIAREYANQMGGDLSYQLREGGGSVFTLSFKAKEAEGVEVQESVVMDGETIKGKHVLLSEDNQTIQMVTQIILQKGGASVEIANNGVEGLALLKENPDKYDFVITDIMMPNMNGYELTRKLREFGFSKPIIGVTAAVIGEESAQLLEAGADQVIEKPIDLPKLNAAYAACIQNADDDDSAEQGT
jgi:signal transduction histidine kinase/ActR/RegA family two-component response regulator